MLRIPVFSPWLHHPQGSKWKEGRGWGVTSGGGSRWAILLLAQGRGTDVNAISHSASLSLCKKMFCLTSYYGCADSRYEATNTDVPRETKLTGRWNWVTSVWGHSSKNSYREKVKGSRKTECVCLFLVYNLLKITTAYTIEKIIVYNNYNSQHLLRLYYVRYFARFFHGLSDLTSKTIV